MSLVESHPFCTTLDLQLGFYRLLCCNSRAHCPLLQCLRTSVILADAHSYFVVSSFKSEGKNSCIDLISKPCKWILGMMNGPIDPSTLGVANYCGDMLRSTGLPFVRAGTGHALASFLCCGCKFGDGRCASLSRRALSRCNLSPRETFTSSC